jgi:hypothetical protein
MQQQTIDGSATAFFKEEQFKPAPKAKKERKASKKKGKGKRV